MSNGWSSGGLRRRAAQPTSCAMSPAAKRETTPAASAVRTWLRPYADEQAVSPAQFTRSITWSSDDPLPRSTSPSRAGPAKSADAPCPPPSCSEHRGIRARRLVSSHPRTTLVGCASGLRMPPRDGQSSSRSAERFRYVGHEAECPEQGQLYQEEAEPQCHAHQRDDPGLRIAPPPDGQEPSHAAIPFGQPKSTPLPHTHAPPRKSLSRG